MDLAKFILDIQASNGVNWPKVKRALIKLGIEENELDKMFNITRYSNAVYEVKVTDQEHLNQLSSLIKQSKDKSRAAASDRGNSHAVNVDGALLVANIIGNTTPYNYLFKSDSLVPLPPKKHCVIIENLECFLNVEQIFNFLTSMCQVNCDIEEVEFIWAAGNSIANTLIIPYLKQFKGDVYCLFDVDFGGLTIYANLIKAGLNPESTRFVIPQDIEKRLTNSKRKMKEEHLNALSRIHGLTVMTDKLITLIRFYKTTLEQESYRYER